MANPLVVLLATLGDPGQLTGGYLYHRRLADLAPLVYRHISVLLVASQYLADQFVLHGIARRRLHVVPPGRDVLAGADASITRDGTQGSMSDLRQGRAAAFLCVANWIPRK